MLAYAANAPRFGERRRSPSALLLIVGVHAIAVGVLMTTKMEVIRDRFARTTLIDIVDPIPPEPTPQPPQPQPESTQQPIRSQVDVTKPIIDTTDTGPVFVDTPIKPPPIGPLAGTGTEYVAPPPIHPPVRVAARFNTPDWALKPPYPDQKRQLEQEATLRLRLSIDATGRVVAVEPVGSVDPVFLSAARKHLIAKWRYRPATEDGRPVASSTVVTLRFELEA